MDNFEALKKSVNDGYNKYKAFEFGKEALAGLDSLRQAENDLKATNKSLEKERNTLLADIEKQKELKKQNDGIALDVLQKAEKKADDILRVTEDDIKERKASADKKIKEISGRIRALEDQETLANKKAQDAQGRLDALNAELEKVSAKFKALAG